MKALTVFTAALICLSFFVPAQSQTSFSGKQDIAELMSLAEQNFDMANEDAVILFEGKKIYWTNDGRQIDFVHRIIWINTDYAIEDYGDHRIAYDSEHCDFNVVTVRTWMDNQWWETGETGIVPTTPDELEHAYDYANVQEMMLLHNGIELPCILEVAYYIEDKEPFRGGIDGIWTFAKSEPVVWSWFGYGVPEGTEPNVEAGRGAGSAEKEKDSEYDLDVYWWKAEMLDKTPVSHIQDPTLDRPYIIYSTWKDWVELGVKIMVDLDYASTFPNNLSSELDSILFDAISLVDSVNSITKYVDSKVRLIDYTNSFWKYSPRSAYRTYETAYGHYLDRTILISAFLRQAGLEAKPMYLTNFVGEYFVTIPTISFMQEMGLYIINDNHLLYYNPYSNSFISGSSTFINNLAWAPDTPGKPAILAYIDILIPKSGFDLNLNSEFNKENGKITGAGIVHSTEAMSLYSKTCGAGNKAKSFLDKMISSTLADAKIINYNPIDYYHSNVQFSLNYEIEKPEQDDNGRISFTIGNPTGGIFDQLPGNIRLTDQTSEVNILLKNPVTETVSINLKLDDIDLVYKPESKSFTNDCGSFELTVAEDNNRLTIKRKISLAKDRYTPEDWDDLRQLLLAHGNKKYNTVIFKTGSDEADKEE